MPHARKYFLVPVLRRWRCPFDVQALYSVPSTLYGLFSVLSQFRENESVWSPWLGFAFDLAPRLRQTKFSTHFLRLFAVTARLGACFYSVIREINAEVLQPLIYFNSTCIFNRQRCAITDRRSHFYEKSFRRRRHPIHHLVSRFMHIDVSHRSFGAAA